MKSILRPLLSIFVALSVVTGLIYPALVAALAKTAFPDQAAGSIVELNGHAVGSSLIGQPFSDAGHFWSRPSATSPNPYNGLASGGSNLSPTNSALADGVKTRIAALKDADPSLNTPVPIDLVTASASGLDPDISPAAAALQIPRIAKARHLNASDLEVLVSEHTTGRQLGFLGEPRVNVLELNLALDALAKS